MGEPRDRMRLQTWRRRALGAGRTRLGRAYFWDAGVVGSMLLGVLSVAIIWAGAWYIASQDAVRTESAAYQDTSNLARAFEEHIIRLIQAHDQILLFARSSIV